MGICQNLSKKGGFLKGSIQKNWYPNHRKYNSFSRKAQYNILVVKIMVYFDF